MVTRSQVRRPFPVYLEELELERLYLRRRGERDLDRERRLGGGDRLRGGL